MQVQSLAIPDVKLITPPRFGDSRGFFSEVFVASRLAEEAGIAEVFVQDNHSLSRDVGVIRGLHSQVAPYTQGKLVRCTRGAIWDVAVDARPGSPTLGQWVGAELSAENWAQLWCPPGFLHGFCTLQPDTEVIYKVTAGYNKASERGVMWDDKDLAIAWPLPASGPVLSDKDTVLPAWKDRGELTW